MKRPLSLKEIRSKAASCERKLRVMYSRSQSRHIDEDESNFMMFGENPDENTKEPSYTAEGGLVLSINGHPSYYAVRKFGMTPIGFEFDHVKVVGLDSLPERPLGKDVVDYVRELHECGKYEVEHVKLLPAILEKANVSFKGFFEERIKGLAKNTVKVEGPKPTLVTFKRDRENENSED